MSTYLSSRVYSSEELQDRISQGKAVFMLYLGDGKAPEGRIRVFKSPRVAWDTQDGEDGDRRIEPDSFHIGKVALMADPEFTKLIRFMEMSEAGIVLEGGK